MPSDCREDLLTCLSISWYQHMRPQKPVWDVLTDGTEMSRVVQHSDLSYGSFKASRLERLDEILGSISDVLLFLLFLFIFDILCFLRVQTAFVSHGFSLPKPASSSCKCGNKDKRWWCFYGTFGISRYPWTESLQCKTCFTWSKHNSPNLQLCTQSSSQHKNMLKGQTKNDLKWKSWIRKERIKLTLKYKQE